MKELAPQGFSFEEKIHRDHDIEWVPQDRDVLADFRIMVWQTVPPTVIEMAVNAFDILSKRTILEPDSNFGKLDILGFILDQVAISIPKPEPEHTDKTGSRTLGDMRKNNGLDRIVNPVSLVCVDESTVGFARLGRFARFAHQSRWFHGPAITAGSKSIVRNIPSEAQGLSGYVHDLAGTRSHSGRFGLPANFFQQGIGGPVLPHPDLRIPPKVGLKVAYRRR